MLTKSILITGGTSGLGKELVKQFLKSGYLVVTTGRQSLEISGYEDKFKLIHVDFSDLKQTALTFRKICETYRFDLVINNAGILSSPNLTKTGDGLEYTFQVNFLSHLLINEIILNSHKTGNPVIIASITSPVYKLAKRDLSIPQDEKNYTSFNAYSESKLYLALMCKYLPVKYADFNLTCIGFDPGVFSSGIFRMRSPVFRFLYRIAAPFMRNPEKVAGVLAGLLMSNEISNGSIYDIKKKKRYISGIDTAAEARFWVDCKNLLRQYLDS
jgi:NAD(P)-dependent dehydrogenase (short-subunit alcohol dehydrogenase family)